jgi:hypothetical protein
VRTEEGQQLELPEGQLDLASVGPDAALPRVQLQPRPWFLAWRFLAWRFLAWRFLAWRFLAWRFLAWRFLAWTSRPAVRAGGGRGDRVADDGQRHPGTRDRHHREQGCAPARRRNPLVSGVDGSSVAVFPVVFQDVFL